MRDRGNDRPLHAGRRPTEPQGRQRAGRQPAMLQAIVADDEVLPVEQEPALPDCPRQRLCQPGGSR
jgi:hypothetical protein